MDSMKSAVIKNEPIHGHLRQIKKERTESMSEDETTRKEMNYVEIDIPPMKLEDEFEEDSDFEEYEEEIESRENGEEGERYCEDIGEDENTNDMFYECEYESGDSMDCEENDEIVTTRKYVEINIPCVRPSSFNNSVVNDLNDKNKKHPCKVCSERFPSLVALKTHMGSHGNYKCTICQKRFMKPHYLRAHMSSHNEDKPFKCDKCNESFTHAISLRAHVVVHAEAKIHACDKCGKVFTRVTRLYSHRLVHGEARIFACTVCKKEYKTLNDLRAHKKLHRNERRFECNICKKRFKRNTLLESHKLCHTDDRPFKCDKCPKQYTVINNLKRHRLTHMPEKPCDECELTFTTLSDLKRHKYIHLGYNPFECEVCHKIFTQSCDLRKHEVTHSGIKPFECSICDKKFTSSSNMNKHKKTLHPEAFDDEEYDEQINEIEDENSSTPSDNFATEVPIDMDKSVAIDPQSINTIDRRKFQCDVCEKYFVSRSNVRKHKRTIHSIDLQNLTSDSVVNVPSSVDVQ